MRGYSNPNPNSNPHPHPNPHPNPHPHPNPNPNQACAAMLAEERAESAEGLAAAVRHAKREAVALVKQRDDEIAELIIKMERMQRAINQVL